MWKAEYTPNIKIANEWVQTKDSDVNTNYSINCAKGTTLNK